MVCLLLRCAFHQKFPTLSHARNTNNLNLNLQNRMQTTQSSSKCDSCCLKVCVMYNVHIQINISHNLALVVTILHCNLFQQTFYLCYYKLQTHKNMVQGKNVYVNAPSTAVISSCVWEKIMQACTKQVNFTC